MAQVRVRGRLGLALGGGLGVAHLEQKQPEKKNQGEIWEEWALTYGRNGSSERKNRTLSTTYGLFLLLW